MISGQDLCLRIGTRELLTNANFRVDKGRRIGIVGRNGAGKSTLTKVLAQDQINSEAIEFSGVVARKGTIGYLPQDPLSGDLNQVAMDRVISARGIDETIRRIKKAELQMSTRTGDAQIKAMEKYVRLDQEFTMAGGWAAQGEASQITAALGINTEILQQPLHTLSGGQRRRIELARILFSGADTLLLDEPTNHIDHDSILWLRDFLRNFHGGFVVISHSVKLLEDTVNEVWHLDAQRASIDIYRTNWSIYLETRANDEKRLQKERALAQKTAARLREQADKIGAKATKAVAAHNMRRRAEELLASIADKRPVEKVANLRFPKPAPCGAVPLSATGISKYYGSLEVFTGINLAIDRGSRVVILGINGAGKTTLLRILAGEIEPTAGQVVAGHGLQRGYFAQEHETIAVEKTVAENLEAVAQDLDNTAIRNILGSFLFSGDDAQKPAGVLSGGEKTRLALAMLVVSAANVLLLDEPTNNLDPASREEILRALRAYEGAVILVTHDPGAVEALNPQRVLLIPDGDEDLWSDDYLDLVDLT